MKSSAAISETMIEDQINLSEGLDKKFNLTIQAVGEATRKSLKALWRHLITFGKYVLKKLDEGADMHNRQVAMCEHYRNQYYLRMF